MIPIGSTRELAAISALPRAIVFIHVNWSAQARQSEAAVRELIAAWKADQPRLSVEAFRIDLSDQSGEIWVATRAWLRDERQPYDTLSYGGGGAIVWLRSGRVVATMPDANQGRDQLRATTLRVFTSAPESGPKAIRPGWLNDVQDAWGSRAPSLAARWFLLVVVFFLLSMVVLALSRPLPGKAAAAAFLLAIVAEAKVVAICRRGYALSQIRSVIFFDSLCLLSLAAGGILLAFF